MNVNGPKSGPEPKYPSNSPSPNQPPSSFPQDPTLKPTTPPSANGSTTNGPSTKDSSSSRVEPSLPREPKSSLHYSDDWKAQAEREQKEREKAQKGYEQKKSRFEEKMHETFKHIKESKKVDEVYNYARENTMDTIAYVFLALGIILLFSYPLVGGFIIGVIAGIYFSREIFTFIQSTRLIFEREERARYIILAGVLVSLFLAAPGFFIGAIVAVAFKQILFNKKPEDAANTDDKDFKNRG